MARHPGWGLFVLRVAVGIVFLVHGAQKLLVEGFSGVSRTMALAGIPAPMAAGVAVTLAEFIGGLLLISGLFTRWAALLLAIEMLVAIVFVHGEGGFFLPRGAEYAFTLLAANLCLALAGPELWGLDARLKRSSYWR